MCAKFCENQRQTVGPAIWKKIKIAKNFKAKFCTFVPQFCAYWHIERVCQA